MFVDNELVLCNFGVGSQRKSKHCGFIYVPLPAKSAKKKSGVWSQDLVFRRHDNAKRWFLLSSQQRDLMVKPKNSASRKSSRSTTIQNTKQMTWKTLGRISEMQIKASKLKCFDNNVYFRVSCNQRKGGDGA